MVGDSLVFRSWYIEEGGRRSDIKLTFRLGAGEGGAPPHEVLINDMLHTADTILTWTPPQRVAEVGPPPP